MYMYQTGVRHFVHCYFDWFKILCKQMVQTGNIVLFHLPALITLTLHLFRLMTPKPSPKGIIILHERKQYFYLTRFSVALKPTQCSEPT